MAAIGEFTRAMPSCSWPDAEPSEHARRLSHRLAEVDRAEREARDAAEREHQRRLRRIEACFGPEREELLAQRDALVIDLLAVDHDAEEVARRLGLTHGEVQWIQEEDR